MRAHLPFPESAAPRLKKGQAVILTSPLLPGNEIRGTVSEIKPGVSETGRALGRARRHREPHGPAPGRHGQCCGRGGQTRGRHPGAGAERRAAAGRQDRLRSLPDGKAVQHVVEVGAKRAGMVEIVRGLPAGATVALDGAGFLTHNAAVTVQERSSPAAGKPAESQPPQDGAAKKPASAKAESAK
ncbi:MAG: efflux RND transporter periplasmic adaptor subunit [Rhodocyclaceae bacterium]|nr:efflux RND transporter periplasmic adaptor subunit [Rhodocyclaceae bacterium]